MVSFESDYNTGAHPALLKRLAETNLEFLSGYGTDRYCESAKKKILDAVGVPGAEVEFLTGGTQTNAVVISTMLADHEGVIAAKTGHINAHEAGAIEYTGHKVIALPQKDGKLSLDALAGFLEDFYADPSRDHMVFPGMVYISYPTEYGTLYSKRELEALREVCRRYGMKLFIDGARLGYALTSYDCDLTLKELASLCDVFYIGGTKVGALCGEAVVFTQNNRPEFFTTSVKKRGAMLAKGRLVGVQFDALFTDGLFFEISRHAIAMAEKMKELFRSKGIEFFISSPTNQQFVVLENSRLERIAESVVFTPWEKFGPDRTVVRFVTSWSTKDEDLKALEAAL
ncbi:MAG: low specificity L-threonine aldolase [Clostridia bacterium]|nr:low specificity L-threonine aldolase [Clostridia bacterium]